MAVTGEYQVRPAVIRDRERLTHLIFDEGSAAHRHLDWRTPLEWVGYPPYFVIEQNGLIESVLACPDDPPGIAWVRVFASGESIQMQDAWNILWEQVRKFFDGKGNTVVCVITLQDWFKKIRTMLPSRQYPQTPNLYGSSSMKKWKVFA